MQVTHLVLTLAAIAGVIDANPLFKSIEAPKANTKTDKPNTVTADSTSTIPSSCSYVMPPTTAPNLHCNVYGTLAQKQIDYLYTIPRSNYESCKAACILDRSTPNMGTAFGDPLGCVAFGYNATSNDCIAYGKVSICQTCWEQIS